MTMRFDNLEKTILNVLEKHSPVVERAGIHLWGFALRNGKPSRCTARLVDEWVIIETGVDNAADEATERSWWELLCLNGMLDGAAKFVLKDDPLSLGLRAEIPLDEDDEEIALPRRLYDTCEALKGALSCLHTGSHSHLKPNAKADTKASWDGFDLRTLCDRTRWPHNQREDGSVAFDLQARKGFQQALARSDSPERVSVSVDLTECSLLPVVSREAISLMLLRASRLVRGARAVVHISDNSAVIRIETIFASRPSVMELEHALAALTVANDLCGQETLALQDEGIAERYLRLQGKGGQVTGSTAELMIMENEARVVAA